MAGGGGASTGRELSETPTWAVAVVCAVIIVVSILLEKGLDHLGELFTKKRKKALSGALEKIKTELMILGFISLLLTFVTKYILLICIPESAADTMLPCRLRKKGDSGGERRRLLWEAAISNSNRRILAADTIKECPAGKVPLVSSHGLHQLHIFIFFLAVFHVAYSAITMALGRAKIRNWKEWEKETSSLTYEFSADPSRFRLTHETTFVRQHASFWSRPQILLYTVSFFWQFFRSVGKSDYLTLRHGFITVHLAPGSKFDFQKYVKRSLEDDFKVVVGVSPVLWASAVIILLLNLHGWDELLWASTIPLVVILAVGTKLQAIIAGMAIDIQERHAVVQGIPLVQLSDKHFWFGRPRLVLFLIHFTLFQNAFQITSFVWMWYEFGLHSCFHENWTLLTARLCLGAAVQFVCSYVTLPLYALVSQMGSQMKRSIFDEQTSKALKKWHEAVRKKKTNRVSLHPTLASRDTNPGTSTNTTTLYRFKTVGHTGRIRESFSDTDNSDQEADVPSTSPPATENLTSSNMQESQQERRIDVDDFSFSKHSAAQNRRDP
uniref:MLO-like protein n=1 Tax=Ananas comosus var. bracteatus TaxID=296719 RepID=A0A6V7QNF6_ANACO|nr:unnamed protein product [Ananas comosus var. bracteatus]